MLVSHQSQAQNVAHVDQARSDCVLIRLDLLELGCNVHLCVDAVSSMSTTDRSTGLHRLANAGAFLTTTESVLFELLRTKDHPNFKAVQGIIKDTRADDPLSFM